MNSAFTKDNGSASEVARGEESNMAPVSIININPSTNILGGVNKNRNIFFLFICSGSPSKNVILSIIVYPTIIKQMLLTLFNLLM